MGRVFWGLFPSVVTYLVQLWGNNLTSGSPSVLIIKMGNNNIYLGSYFRVLTEIVHVKVS